METNVVCAKCGAINIENAKFCNNCGSEIAIINKASTSSDTQNKKSKKPIIIGIASVVAIFLIVLFAVIIPKSGNNAIKKKFKNLSIGDTVTFGKYEQDNAYAKDGEEDIEWIVLDIQGDSYLLISKYGLEAMPFNNESGVSWNDCSDVTWETSSIRKWLNEDFYNSAFSSNEKTYISTSCVVAYHNMTDGVDAGNNTYDKVYLLSTVEASLYFGNDSARACNATKYAKDKGADVGKDGTCYWWLRTPGRRANRVAIVEMYDLIDGAFLVNAGEINDAGDSVIYSGNCVRPVIWVDMNKSTDIKNEQGRGEI